ncbi:MAG: hypothetical protein ACOX39_02830 [Arcobacteraceae bacterium]|nr:hypothetical protein [Arcobacteraceae bacterium]
MKQKLLLLLAVLLLLGGCSLKQPLNIDKEAITLYHQDNEFSYLFQNPHKKTTFHSCVASGYMISDQNIHIESIKLRSWCMWKGLASSYYQNFLNANLKGLKLKQRYKEGRYDIFLYQKDDMEFYFISTYTASSKIFILDYEGFLAAQLCNKCYLIDRSMQLDSKIYKSMLERDMIEGYFSRISRSRYDN